MIELNLYLNQNSLSKEKYIEIAKNLGLDLKKFSLDIMRPSLRKKVEEDIQDAQKAGVTGTPSIFVNGRQLKIRDFQTLSKLIDAELAEGQK